MKNFKNAVALLWKTSKLYFIFTFILSISSSVPEIINLVIWKKILDLVFVFLTKNTVDFKQIILYVFLHFILKISADILSRLNEFIKNIYCKFWSNGTLISKSAV